MRCLCAAMVVGLLAGCSGDGAVATVVNSVVPVSGKIVQADGKPLANAWVVFNPKDPPANEATAATEADGTFRLGTFTKEDGIIPGRYVVTIQPHPNVTSGAPKIPSRYGSVATSPWTVEITRDRPKELPPHQLK